MTKMRPEWMDGEWNNEPDHELWVDEATGLTCEIIRHNLYGYWCGYIHIDNPDNEIIDEELLLSELKKYDGEPREVTYSELYPDGVLILIIGFSCAHYTHLIPAISYRTEFDGKPNKYINLEKAKTYCQELAAAYKRYKKLTEGGE